MNQQGANSFSERKYWSGYWWRIWISNGADGQVGVYVSPSMSLNGGVFGASKPRALAYGIQVRRSGYVPLMFASRFQKLQ